jgi:benzoyl-CoA reductase subunit C
MAKAMSEVQGLSTAEQISQARSQRARQLRDRGKKIVGYFCAYTPVEMLTAAGLVPYRIMGNPREPAVHADSYLESIMCSFVRSCFDVALRGGYDFLDGFVACHACDNIGKIYNIWRHNFKPSFSCFVNVPNTTSPASLKFFRAELATFLGRLETFSGSKLTEQRLIEAIKLHNENRSLMREIYALRKPDPPLLSAVEMNKVLVASQSIPVEESNELLHSVIRDVGKRRNGPTRKLARLMLVGSEIDDSPLFGLIEDSGANIVVDDACVGTRIYWHDVETEGDPLNNLAIRYLEKVKCPRTVRQRTRNREEDLENKFGHILGMAREFSVNGVVLYVLRYCDNFGFDVPDLRSYLEKAGLKVLHIEDEYLISSARLKTRVEAFIEMID